MILRPELAERVFNSLLMIDPGKAAAILAGIGGRIVDGGVEFSGVAPIDHTAFSGGRLVDSMGRLGDRVTREYAADREPMYDMVGGVALLPIEGTLVHKGAYIGKFSGRTSYEGIIAQANAARRDSGVRGAVYEVDSFGGEVAGAFDAAEALAELSRAKPTLAILTDHAFSAGYLLASTARQIVMPETGGAGSIGVITLHVDYSKQLERAGVKVTVLSSGKFKAEGHPFGELATDTVTKIQKRLDMGRDIFADAVGRFRGMRLTKEAALATEAEAFSGPDAVTAGLVDGIVRPTEAFEKFVSLMR